MWRFIRIPKAIALLAFLLPWMTVSCSSQKLAEATGAELVIGKVRPLIGAAAKAAPQGQQINWYLVIAIALVVVGLALGFLAKRYAPAVIGTSLGAILFVWLGTNQYSTKIAEAADKADRGGSNDLTRMGQMTASMIHVDWQIGYWITLLSLAAAAVMAFLTIADRSPSGAPRG